MSIFDLFMEKGRVEEFFLREHRLGYERALIVVLWLGFLATLVGTIVSIGSTFTEVVDPKLAFRVGIWTAVGGVALLTLSVLVTKPLDRLSRYRASERSGSTYERRRNWTRLKTGSILLNLLVVLAALELGIALFSSFGGQSISLPASLSVERITMLLVLAVASAFMYSHRVSLKIERREHAITGLEVAFFALGMSGALVFTALAALIVRKPTELPLIGETIPGHSTLFLLAGVGAAGVALFIARELPTITALYLEEREFRQTSYLSRRKSVVMPTMIAFALLFLVLLLVFVLELSLVGEFETISQSVILFGVFGFIVVALIASAIVSFSLSRSEDQTALYKRLRTEAERTEITVMAISGVLGALFLAMTIQVASGNGLIGFDVASHRWVDVLSLGLLASLGPYGFYYAHQASRVRDLEERFPDFLRDVAASRKAGLTLTNSVKIAAKGEYGALTPDVEKMADQLSWNVSFEEALDRFADRVDTPLVRRATTLINEAGRSGGHVVDVLEAAATDAREIKTLENERRLTMSLYTVVIYIAFLVFLGVAAVLYGQFIPEVLASTEGVASQNVGGAASGPIGQIGTSGLGLSDYRTFFFVASIAQGLGNGVLAGMMESGRPLNGLKHAFAMVAITLVVFLFFI